MDLTEMKHKMLNEEKVKYKMFRTDTVLGKR